MSDVVIRVENLSKRYRLGLIGGTTLREDASRWWAKLRGQPDPTLRVDQVARGQERGARSPEQSVESGRKGQKARRREFGSRGAWSRPIFLRASPFDFHAPRSSPYVWALRDVSFEVKRGEILGMIRLRRDATARQVGRNGAGFGMAKAEIAED